MNFNDFIKIYDLKDGGKINVDYWHLKKTGIGATCDIRDPSETFFVIEKNDGNYNLVTKENTKEIRLVQKDSEIAYHKDLKSLIIVQLNEDDNKPSTEVHILSRIVKVNK